MIIFQAQPSRLYPQVISNILNNISITYEEFHYPFLVRRSIDVININNILKSITKFQKHERESDFLYGVFSSSHLNLKNGDFIFTLINHPINQIYEAYAYYSFIINKNINSSNEILNLQSEVLKKIPHLTLERFIDLIIKDSDLSFDYCGFKYNVMNEMIYGFKNFDHFNYVGKYSHINHLYNILNKNFNFCIPFLETDKQYAYCGKKYKLNTLKQKFKKQIDFYKELDYVYKYDKFI